MTREHDDILTAKTDRLREASGGIRSSDPLVLFIYLLARNELPVGAIEGIMGEIEVALENFPCVFTNGWLATWAEDVADRLLP